MGCDELIAEYEKLTGRPRALITVEEYLLFRREAMIESGRPSCLSDSRTWSARPEGHRKLLQDASAQSLATNANTPRTRGDDPDSGSLPGRSILSVLRSVPG